MIHKLDKYDLILEEKGFGIKGQSDQTTDVEKETTIKKDSGSMTELMDELGITSSNKPVYKLIIWNDNFNDMLYVIITLCEVCDITNDESMIIMMKAHKNGRAVVKYGSQEEMNEMKKNLNVKGLEATVEQ